MVAAESFAFRSGRVSIDLTATYAWHGRKAGLDRLSDSSDLDEWIEQSPLTHTRRSTEEELAQIRRLRDAVYSLASLSAFGSALDAEAVAIVNDFARDGAPIPQLLIVGEHLTSPAAPSAPLGVLARDAVDLFSGPYTRRVRECQYTACWVLFVDTSTANTRRWCSVHCGQRVAARNYRERQKRLAAID